MSDEIVISHHILSGSKIFPTATLDVVVNGDKKQVASTGQSPLDALHQALYKAFGYKVDSHVIDGPLEDREKKKIEGELTLIISRDGRRHVAQERFPWDPEREGLYGATIAVYLKALREQKI